MAVKRSDFTRVRPGVYKGPGGKEYSIGSGSLDALVEKLNKGKTSAKTTKTDKSVTSPADKATAEEFQKKYDEIVKPPATIVDPYEKKINDLNDTQGAGIDASTPEQKAALEKLNLGLSGGYVDPLEKIANDYLVNRMNQGLTQEERDATLSTGASTINRNLMGVLRSAMGQAGGQGLNRSSSIGQSMPNINEAGGLLQELARKLVVDDIARKDAAGIALGTQLNSQLSRRNDAYGNAMNVYGNVANNISTNRVAMFNQMMNTLVSQQASNLNLQGTNIANQGARDLGAYGAYMTGYGTSVSAKAAEDARKIQEKQLELASRGFSNNRSGTSYQPGSNNSPSFPDPGTGQSTGGSTATSGSSTGGM